MIFKIKFASFKCVPHLNEMGNACWLCKSCEDVSDDALYFHIHMNDIKMVRACLNKSTFDFDKHAVVAIQGAIYECDIQILKLLLKNKIIQS